MNCVHPGAVATGLGRQNGWAASALLSLACPFMRTPAKRADTVVRLATAPEFEGVSGKYFFERREKRGSREPNDVEVAKRLWNVSKQLTQRSA